MALNTPGDQCRHQNFVTPTSRCTLGMSNTQSSVVLNLVSQLNELKHEVADKDDYITRQASCIQTQKETMESLLKDNEKLRIVRKELAAAKRRERELRKKIIKLDAECMRLRDELLDKDAELERMADAVDQLETKVCSSLHACNAHECDNCMCSHRCGFVKTKSASCDGCTCSK